jgi:hypothetical protein
MYTKDPNKKLTDIENIENTYLNQIHKIVLWDCLD